MSCGICESRKASGAETATNSCVASDTEGSNLAESAYTSDPMSCEECTCEDPTTDPRAGDCANGGNDKAANGANKCYGSQGMVNGQTPNNGSNGKKSSSQIQSGGSIMRRCSCSQPMDRGSQGSKQFQQQSILAPMLGANRCSQSQQGRGSGSYGKMNGGSSTQACGAPKTGSSSSGRRLSQQGSGNMPPQLPEQVSFCPQPEILNEQPPTAEESPCGSCRQPSNQMNGQRSSGGMSQNPCGGSTQMNGQRASGGMNQNPSGGSTQMNGQRSSGGMNQNQCGAGSQMNGQRASNGMNQNPCGAGSQINGQRGSNGMSQNPCGGGSQTQRTCSQQHTSSQEMKQTNGMQNQTKQIIASCCFPKKSTQSVSGSNKTQSRNSQQMAQQQEEPSGLPDCCQPVGKSDGTTEAFVCPSCAEFENQPVINCCESEPETGTEGNTEQSENDNQFGSANNPCKPCSTTDQIGGSGGAGSGSRGFNMDQGTDDTETDQEEKPKRKGNGSGRGFWQQLQFQVFQQQDGDEDDGNNASQNGNGGLEECICENEHTSVTDKSKKSGNKIWQQLTLDLFQSKDDDGSDSEGDCGSRQGWQQQVKLQIFQEKSNGDGDDQGDNEVESPEYDSGMENGDQCA